MREIFNFLRWRWRNWETWQKAWMAGCFFFGAGLGADGQLRFFFFAVPVTIFTVYTFKWWIYEPILSSWNEYKRQRDTLFDTIRGDKE